VPIEFPNVKTLQTMAATLEIHFLTLKYTHCQFCQNYPKKVAKIKLILAKLAFATDYEACLKLI
jgi:hypothetical protein